MNKVEYDKKVDSWLLQIQLFTVLQSLGMEKDMIDKAWMKLTDANTLGYTAAQSEYMSSKLLSKIFRLDIYAKC